MRSFNSYISITILSGLLAFPLPVTAQELLRADTQFYVPDATSPSKYKEIIKWPIVSALEWNNFMKTIETATLDKTPHKFIPDGKTEVVHIVKRNPDLLTGRDYYLTPGHITEVITSSLDIYAVTDPRFREYMEKELKDRFSFSEKPNQTINQNTPGIVVMYYGSETLQNPMWLVNKPKEMAPYISFIQKSAILSPPSQAAEAKKSIYNKQDTFVIYLNVPNAPAKFITLASKGHIKMSNTSVQSKSYIDTTGIFESFKRKSLLQHDPEKYQKIYKATSSSESSKTF